MQGGAPDNSNRSRGNNPDEDIFGMTPESEEAMGARTAAERLKRRQEAQKHLESSRARRKLLQEGNPNAGGLVGTALREMMARVGLTGCHWEVTEWLWHCF